jgi:hypothetical protein
MPENPGKMIGLEDVWSGRRVRFRSCERRRLRSYYNKTGVFMKRPAFILMLALFCQASFSRAQLAPYNKSGVTWGHVHLHPKDRYKETLALMSLGAELGNNLSPNVPLVFPGVLILLQEGQKPPTGGSEGTVMDHVAFRVPNLEDTLARVKAANWGMHAKDEPGTKPGQAYLLTPSEVKIELLEDKRLKQPIVFDHVHFLVPESGLQEMETYYKTMYGATGEGGTLSLPGGKLMFSKSENPTKSPTGTALDHIGFDIAGSHEGLEAFSKSIDAKGTKWSARYRKSEYGNARPMDPSGVVIELTHGQDGYTNYKHIEQAMVPCEARPMKPPCW